MKDVISFMVKGREYSFANSWQNINSYCFMALVQDFTSMLRGDLEPAMVKINYVCNCMGWNINKMNSLDLENLMFLADQVTFPFRIVYPDNDAVLDGLDQYTYELCKRYDPHKLSGITLSRHLETLPYHFVPDSCFCKQMIPHVTVDRDVYTGYTIDTSFGMLTTSLTALQYIEARELIGKDLSMLPLLAAILYCPGKYSSDAAHQLAAKFSELSSHELTAIAFNFQAFNNYLFTQTEYSLLVQGKDEPAKSISTGAKESLYNLSSDGLGDIKVVEDMNLLTYLSILRKKMIDTVLGMHATEMSCADISEKTGLSIHLIKKMI